MRIVGFILWGLEMSLKKFKISYGANGQSVMEYTLLVTIAIIGILVVGMFVSRLKTNAFEDHFQAAGHAIGGAAYDPTQGN